ncbi:MAG: class II fructose-bisphosphate aldolase [Hespellia sp.]|jgi:fructose-bisphosphate aldolase class II|nr:class II fructose-bisphosphate aldolase [Hespellia sp.]
MALVTMKELLSVAKDKNYAVGAFDTLEYITAEAIIRAAEKRNTPVIVMVMPMSLDDPNADAFMGYLTERCRRSSVPVALHLDHSPTYEACVKGIQYGCTSVMFDGSSLPYEENVRITKKVIEAARACGVTVEAEIGHVAGHEGNMLEGNVADPDAYTTVEEALRFYKDTDVDCLAVAIGTVHGVYKGTPKIDYERLDAIKKELPIPIVLHGGSGLGDEDYKKLVAHGINKINFYTAMTLAGAAACKQYIEETPRFQFTDVIAAGQQAEEAVVDHHIEVFGTLSVLS